MPADPALDALGPYFAVTSTTTRPEAPWRTMAELVEGPDAVDERIEQVRERLAAASGASVESIERRVALSTVHLGVAARLIAPALAVAVLGGGAAPPRLRDFYWQPTLGGPFPLLWVAPDGPGLDARELVDGPLTELTETMAGRTTLSAHVLWGNVASGINSAARLLQSARPDLVRRVDALATDALAAPALHGEFRTEDGFRRTSCCLFYRVSPGRSRALCGDCVLEA